MYFSKQEEEIISPLFKMIDKNIKEYEMKLQDDTVLIARLDTCYETDNGDDEPYMEFFACLFVVEKILSPGKGNKLQQGDFLEITYLNYPQYIKPVDNQ